MRLFLAIDLDDAARVAAAGWLQALSSRLGASTAREIKWVDPANLHLTVHFFGELADDRADAVRRTFRTPASDARPFELALAGSGTFPPASATRVIWLGIRDTRDAMQAMYRDVETRLATIGLQEESTRGFTPHLTIGRVRTPSSTLGRTIREAMQATPAPSPRFLVSGLTLYQSRLSPKGPTYHPIDRFPLTS